MSALPPKADMCSATADVRFVPIADMNSPRLMPDGRKEPQRKAGAPVRQRLVRGKPNPPLPALGYCDECSKLCYCGIGVPRQLPVSIGPNDKAKPKNATHQAKAVTWSSASLHPGSNEAQIRASDAITTVA